MNVLGIETSCDETAAAVVVEGRDVLSSVVSSQLDIHKDYGGIVPELAARAQLTAILPIVRQALAEASIGFREIDAFAVTYGPGLAGSLLVGVNVAKTLAYVRDLPLVPVNHLEAHLYANWLAGAAGEVDFPMVVLLVSGGHSELILMEGHGRYRHLGRTLDDAAGEAFDKAARLLGLGYPGGPLIQQAAEDGDVARFTLPRAWLEGSWDFSFSGLKTALLREVEPWRLPQEPVEMDPQFPFTPHRPPTFQDGFPVADLAAAFQEAVVDVLATKTIAVARETGARHIAVAGGVAANAALRERVSMTVESIAVGERPKVTVPDFTFCTDNAAMVAGAGYFLLRRGEQAGWELDVSSRAALTRREMS